MIFFNANRVVRAEDAVGHGIGGNIKAAIGAYSLVGSLSNMQVIPMVAVPTGARIVDVIIASDALDSGAGLKVDIGDKTKSDRYFSGSSIVQAGGVEHSNVAAGIAHRYDKTDTINVTVASSPAMQAQTGSLKVTVLYVID